MRRKLPSSAEEGWPKAGVVLVNKLILLNNTTRRLYLGFALSGSRVAAAALLS
jgi:hypothetical protein